MNSIEADIFAEYDNNVVTITAREYGEVDLSIIVGILEDVGVEEEVVL